MPMVAHNGWPNLLPLHNQIVVSTHRPHLQTANSKMFSLLKYDGVTVTKIAFEFDNVLIPSR
jgi:hypothetical protein